MSRERSWSPEPRYERELSPSPYSKNELSSPQFVFKNREATPTMVTRSQSKARESTPTFVPNKHQSKARESTPLPSGGIVTRSQSKVRETTPLPSGVLRRRGREITPESTMTTKSQLELSSYKTPEPKFNDNINEDLSEKFSSIDINKKNIIDTDKLKFSERDTPLSLKIHRPKLFLKHKNDHQFPLDYCPLNEIPIQDVEDDLITITTLFCDDANIIWEPNVSTDKVIIDNCPQDADDDGNIIYIDDQSLNEPYSSIILFSEPTQMNFQITPFTRRSIIVYGTLKEVLYQIYYVFHNNPPDQKEYDTLPKCSHINAKYAKTIGDMITWNAFCGFKRIKGEWWLP